MNQLLWPDSLVEFPGLVRLIEACKPAVTGDDDLFVPAQVGVPSLDGQVYASAGRWQIAQWLYLAGLRYGVNQALPVEESLQADFYLPDWRIYLELWGEDEHPDALSERLHRQVLYREHELPVVDIQVEELPQLDDVLGGRLGEMGVSFY